MCSVQLVCSLQVTANGPQTNMVMMQLLSVTELLASIRHVAGAMCGCGREHVLL